MPIKQCVDTGISREELEKYLCSRGYWGTPDLRRRNAYVLSPSAYKLTRAQYTRLESLSLATYAALENLDAKLSSLGEARSLTHEESAFLRMSRHGVRKLLSPRDGVRGLPPMCKIDLVQDRDGVMHVVEVDVYNPRGLAFIVLLDGSIVSGCARPGSRLDGIASTFAERKRGDAVWLVVVSEFERYYEPSFTILAEALTARGMRTRVVREKELADSFDPRTCTHVLHIPETLYERPDLRDAMIAAYKRGMLVSLYPPKAYLGSKAFLPHLAQSGMADFVPPSELVGKHCMPNGVILEKPSVLKGTVSSGMKKVIFSDLEPERFELTLAEACTSKIPLWILQQQVIQSPVSVCVFDEAGGREIRDFYLRITAYVSQKGLLGMEVTGRPDRMVHGAPDCIQILCVL